MVVVTFNVVVVFMGDLEKDIKQKKFRTEYNKALVNLIFTSNYFHQLQLSFLRKYDLTVPQFNILRILRGQYPNASTVNLLIDRMLDKSSNASRIVDKLENKQLVIRKQCPSDRRAVDVFISKEGLDLLSKIDEEFIDWESAVCTLEENECAELNRLLDKMRG